MSDVKFTDNGLPYVSSCGGGDPGGYVPSAPGDPQPESSSEASERNNDGRWKDEIEVTYSGSRGGTNDTEIDVPTGKQIWVPNQSKTPGACFVATAVYGNINSPEVQVLRDFRDNVLMENGLGRKVVDFYYRGVGERVADFIKTQVPSVIPLIRKGLDYIVHVYQRRT